MKYYNIQWNCTDTTIGSIHDKVWISPSSALPQPASCTKQLKISLRMFWS